MATYSLNTPYIAITGAVVIAIVIVFTIFQPMLGTIQEVRDRKAAAQITLREKEDFLRNLDRKREELQIQRVHEERLNVMFPTSDAYDDAIRVISLAADGAGTVIQKIDDKSNGLQAELNARRSRGEAVAIPETVTPLAAVVDLVGTYQQLRAFLVNLEKSPRLMDVQKIEVQRLLNQPDQLGAKMTVQFYYRGE